MRSILAKYKIDAVWHFTDRSNLESITRHRGILSLGELERRGIEIPRPGGNEWSHDADKMNGVHDYVHLAFVRDHPMLYRARQDGRIQSPVWLKIKSSILLLNGVRFCDEVSNKSGSVIFDSEEAKERIDFEVLFTRMDWRNPEINMRRQTAVKAEILIPKFVPIENILDYQNG